MKSVVRRRRELVLDEAELSLNSRSQADLREILLDIAEDSPAAAERLRAEFYDGLRKLARSPGIGHYHEELLDNRFRFWNFYSYVVCYLWAKKPIRIVAVVHGARELSVLLTLRRTSDS